MFKVSFKDNFKKIERFNDCTTVVTLTGRIKLPNWFIFGPVSITEWAYMYSGQEVNIDFSRDIMTVTTKGKTVRAEGDADNPILAERIAESRAKISLYKFMVTLLNKLISYYRHLLIGDMAVQLPELYKAGLYKEWCKYKDLLTHEQMHLNKLLLEA